MIPRRQDFSMNSFGIDGFFAGRTLKERNNPTETLAAGFVGEGQMGNRFKASSGGEAADS